LVIHKGTQTNISASTVHRYMKHTALIIQVRGWLKDS